MATRNKSSFKNYFNCQPLGQEKENCNPIPISIATGFKVHVHCEQFSISTEGCVYLLQLLLSAFVPFMMIGSINGVILTPRPPFTGLIRCASVMP